VVRRMDIIEESVIFLVFKKSFCSFESYKVLRINLYIYEGGDGNPNK
jgi:hypothetical protein